MYGTDQDKARRRSQSIAWLVIRTLVLPPILLIMSPIVIFVDIFRKSKPVSKMWAIWFMVILGLTVGVSWSMILYLNGVTEDAASVFASYASVRDEVKSFPFSDLINYYAIKNDLDPSLVAAVIAQESQFDADAVSSRGARGLMQIMPETWREFNPSSTCTGDHAPPADGSDCIFSYEANIRTGTAYLRYLLDRYNGDVIEALAAYNAGVAKVDRQGGDQSSPRVPPYAETQNYIRRVINYWSSIRHDMGVFDVDRFRAARQWQRWLIVISIVMWFVLFTWLIRRAYVVSRE